MSKILVFSDLHSHCFKPYATILENGRNSRLQDAIDCIDQIREYAIETQADLVLFCGDLFHTRKHVATQTFNATYEAIAKFQVYGIPLVMIHGNHDQEDRAGKFHSLYPFGSFAQVVNKDEAFDFKCKNGEYVYLTAIPYVEDANHLKDILTLENILGGRQFPVDGGTPTIFMGHMGIMGANAGANFIYRNPVEPVATDLPSSKFDVGFLGHFHIRQSITGNFGYVGAPLQHNWGDTRQARGFVEYDTDTKQQEFIQLNAPKFIEILAGDIAINNQLGGRVSHYGHKDLENNFVRIVDHKPWSDDEREAYRSKYRARHVEVVKPKMDVEEAYEIRLKLDPTSSYEDMIKDYVTSDLVELEGLDEDHLISIGRGIIEGLEEE